MCEKIVSPLLIHASVHRLTASCGEVGGAVCVLAVVTLLSCRGVCGTWCPRPSAVMHVDKALAREGNDREVGLGLTAGSRQGQRMDHRLSYHSRR